MALEFETEKKELSFDSDELDIKVEEVESIENDDFLAVDLLRDPKVKDELIDSLWEANEERIEEKINFIPKLILDMNTHVQMTAVYLLQNDLTEEEYKMAKVKFIEMRLEATKHRLDGGIELNEDDEDSVAEYQKFVIESGALFDFYIKQIQDAFITSVKERTKVEN